MGGYGAVESRLDFRQLHFVADADSIFEPMMNLGLGKSQLPPHPTGRQLILLDQLMYLVRCDVQIGGQRRDIKIFHRDFRLWVGGAGNARGARRSVAGGFPIGICENRWQFEWDGCLPLAHRG